MSAAQSIVPACDRHESRIVAIEEWRKHLEHELRRREDRASDFEARIRALEAAQMRLAGKIGALSVIGSAIATAVVQIVIKAVGQ